ncbi:MAG: ATP-binding protein [Candidatus Nealsonbacteria bacterium]
MNINELKVNEQIGQILEVISYFTDGLLIFDKNKKLILINPQAEKFLDLKSDQVIGKQLLELNSFSFFQKLIDLVGGGIKELLKKDIEITPNLILEISVVSMKSEEKDIGSLVILHDITQQKMVERIKSEFIGLAAHQLRTPSSAVKWIIKMLLDGDLGDITKEQRESIEKAYKANERMIRLINDLLNVAQIEQGKYLSKLALLDIENVLQSVVSIYKEKIEEKGIKFEFNLPEDKLPKVMLDQEKIEIAFRNLVDNSIRYTLKGGEINVNILKKTKEMEIQIRDTGLGIPKNQQDKIFDSFFRANNILKVDTEGTGLGLFIAKNIIEAHGGRIWFESEENKGSTFYFTIPIREKFSEFLTKDFY